VGSGLGGILRQIVLLIVSFVSLIAVAQPAAEVTATPPAVEAPAATPVVQTPNPPPGVSATPAAAPLAPPAAAVPAPIAPLVLSAPSSAPLPTLKVSGQVREKGTKKILPGVNVYAFSPPTNPVPSKAVTDAKGNFVMQVPEGPVRWKIVLANYNGFERSETLGANPSARSFFLEKKSYLVYETTIFGQEEKRDDKTQSLTQEQFLTLPGSNGDPVKAVQNLPGVNRASSFSAQVIIEGSAPSDTLYNIDTQPVPQIFHFGGLDSVIMPEAVDRVDYLSAGFGPEYGNTTAGFVNLTTRDPQDDRTHGMAFVDLFHAGGEIETQLNDHSSLLLGVRKSYIGRTLALAAKGNSKFDLTVAPDFDDGVLVYKNRLNSQDSLKILGVGSLDTLGFVQSEPSNASAATRGNFNETVSFYRLIPEYTHKFNTDTTGRLWMGLGQDSTLVNFGTLYYNDRTNVFSSRAEVETQASRTWKTYIGFDNNANWSTNAFQIPFINNQGGGQTSITEGSVQTVSRSYFEDYLGGYWRNVIHSPDSRFTYLPGLRVDYFSLTKQVLPEPRLAVRYAMDHGLTLRAATGLYYEAPPVQDMDSSFGNPQLKAQQALHYTIGFEKDFRRADQSGWLWTTDLFYKQLSHLVMTTSNVTSSGQPQYYSNDGQGRVVGAEFMIKYQSKKWSGWLAYTLAHSTRTYPPLNEQLFQYDQTHNLILVGERELGHNWKFSGRLRYTTGNPYTPAIGSSYDADNDTYVPQYAGAYSQRMPAFFEADVRFDKKWVFETWILSFYVDVENATNNKNVEQINYSYDYSQHAQITGLPLLPYVGLKGEF
jgi:hypothetical protein